MKVLWVFLLVALIILEDTEAAKKKKPKGKGKPKPTGKCPVDNTSTKQFEKYTVTKKGQTKQLCKNLATPALVGGKVRPVADQACWFDASRTDCAQCKPTGQPCGFPMQKWCQSKKAKTVSFIKTQYSASNLFIQGCKGIPNYKYTLSSTGYPCYWDYKRLVCNCFHIQQSP